MSDEKKVLMGSFSVPRKAYYADVVRPSLMKRGGYTNLYAVPRLKKIVLNMGWGRKLQDKNVLEAAMEGLADISGQKPCLTRAKKSIAGFKIREEVPIGLMVTLRRDRMMHFLHRLVVIAMPRIRDFRGISPKSFDGQGNISLGIKEHHIFPEIKYDKISDILGLDVSIVTTAQTDQEAKMLLEELGIPFRD